MFVNRLSFVCSIELLGRNSIIVILGANLLLNEDDLQRAEEIIRQSHVVVCQLEIRQETVVKTFEIARKHSGKTKKTSSFGFHLTNELVLTIFNPAPMPEKFNRDLLKIADVICPNQSEV